MLNDLYIPSKTDRKINNKYKSIKSKSTTTNIDFITAIKTWAKTDRGDSVTLNNCLMEYGQLISNLKIHETLTSGCCQNSKTLLHNLLHIYLVVEQKYNSLWVYSQERVLNKMVNLQFKPMIRFWLTESDRENSSRDNAKNNTIYQFEGANAIFSYASTGNKGNTAAGKSMVSFSADIAFYEERSQWDVGSDAPVARRLDASRIPTKPRRQLGTPGRSGTGITEAGKNANHQFEPHCICSSCGEEIRLNPEGTLLHQNKRIKPNGEVLYSYTAANGRPLSWFYHHEADKIKSAYFGCPHCHAEIPKRDRIQNSYFKCIKTGITAKEFLNQAEYDPRLQVFIYLSPLLKDTEYNLASDIINEGLTTSETEDWYQQQIGLASRVDANKLTIEMIKRAITRPMPEFTYNQWELPVKTRSWY